MGKFFLKGELWWDTTKKDLKNLSCPKTTLRFLVILQTSTLQHLFGVRMQDYFNFQVHAHTVVPELLTFKVLVLLAQSYINFYKKNNTIHQNINS